MTNDITTQDLSVTDWDIRINPLLERGSFEWVGGTNEDEECAGGLWFKGKKLIDYDGVFALPKIVKEVLIKSGYSLEEI
jgi:hypothetical protein